MIDDLLEAGAAFDWISPVAKILGDWARGPSHTFLIPIDASPLTGREVNLLLKRKGIKNWGHMIVSGTLMTSVRQNQARWAQHLLQQAGVPVDNPLPAEQARKAAPKKARGKFKSSNGWTCGHCGNWYRERLSKCPSCGGGYMVAWRK